MDFEGFFLENKLGVEIQDFAYPFGNIDSINEDAMAIVKQRYKYIYSGVRGTNMTGTNSAAIKREAIDIKDSLSFNLSVVKGGLAFFYKKDREELESIAE